MKSKKGCVCERERQTDRPRETERRVKETERISLLDIRLLRFSVSFFVSIFQGVSVFDLSCQIDWHKNNNYLLFF